MNPRMLLSSVIALAVAAGVATANPKAQTKPTVSRDTAALKQIEAAFGFVPAFVKAIPAALLPSWWDAVVSFEMNPNTKIDAKTRELIGLAVAAQVPCEYCVLYHTEAAKLNGATDQELQEAVAMAASVRQNSTFLNGMQVDRVQFRRDVERIVKTARQQQAKK